VFLPQCVARFFPLSFHLHLYIEFPSTQLRSCSLLFLNISICALWVALLGNLFISSEEHGRSHTSNNICCFEHKLATMLFSASAVTDRSSLSCTNVEYSLVLWLFMHVVELPERQFGQSSKPSACLVARNAIQHPRIVLRRDNSMSSLKAKITYTELERSWNIINYWKDTIRRTGAARCTMGCKILSCKGGIEANNGLVSGRWSGTDRQYF
jgi:hypothetical protein